MYDATYVAGSKKLRLLQVGVVHAKYCKVQSQLKESCMRAIEQIDDKMYAIEFEDTYDEALCYGISFFKKRCIVMKK